MAKSKGKKRGGGAAAADAAGGSQSAEPGKVLKKSVAQSGVAESVGTGAPAPSAKRRKQSRDVGSVSGGTAPPSAAHPTPTATTKTTKSKNKKKKKKNTNTKVSDGAGAGAGAAAAAGAGAGAGAAADDAGTGLASVFAAVSSGPQLVAASTLDDAAAEAAAVAAAAAAAKQKKEKDADAKRRGKFSFAGDVEPEERLKRTLFVGNVAVSVSAKLIRRLVTLAVQHGPNIAVKTISAAAKKKPRTVAGDSDASDVDDEDVDDEDVDDGEEEEEEEEEDNEEEEEEEDSELLLPTTPSERIVESVRTRSIAISGTAVPSGANFRAMRRACAITGQVDTSIKDTYNLYVVLRDVKHVQSALALNSKVLQGKHLRVDVATGTGSSTSADPKRSVFVGNIPFNASEEQLRAVFAGVVEGGDDSIVSVRLVRDRATNKGKGIGYVNFKERIHVFQALGANGTTFGSRELRVVRCKDTTKAGAYEGHRTGGRAALASNSDKDKKDKGKGRGKAGDGALRRLTKKSTAAKMRAVAKEKRTKKTLSSMSKALKRHNKGTKLARQGKL